MGVTEILISWFVKIFFGSIAVGGLLMIFAKGLTYIPALIGLLFKLIAKGISSLIKVILRLLKKENKNQDETQNILEDSEFLFSYGSEETTNESESNKKYREYDYSKSSEVEAPNAITEEEEQELLNQIPDDDDDIVDGDFSAINQAMQDNEEWLEQLAQYSAMSS